MAAASSKACNQHAVTATQTGTAGELGAVWHHDALTWTANKLESRSKVAPPIGCK